MDSKRWAFIAVIISPIYIRIFAQQTVQCVDDNRLCSFWAGLGECSSNGPWMLEHCKISCNMCSASPASQSPSQPPPGVQFAPPRTLPLPPPPPPTPPPRNPFDRCGEIQNNATLVTNASILIHQERLILPFEDVSRRSTVSINDVKASKDNSNCALAQQIPISCNPNVCYNVMFRTMDGTCNNFQHPEWGAAFTPLHRHFAPIYDDGLGAIVGSFQIPRPNPRELSLNLLRSGQVVTNDGFNSLLMQWGQFVSHDIVKTSLMPHDLCNSGSCRDGTGKCANIPVNPFDPNARRFGCDAQGCCVKTPRAAAVCGTGFTNPREQLNENTAFIDGSMIYGSSLVDSRNFRAGNSGFLRMEFFDSGGFLPIDQRKECPHSGACIKAKFQAGDDRANVFLGLAAMHTLFAREHNRLVEALQQLNPHWMGDTLYQEARKIVGAELQAITYKEWLPKILSSKAFDTRFVNYTKYNSSINPSITSEFSGAAFRFGHGMIPEFFQRIDAQGSPIPQGGVRFLDGLLKSEKLISEGGLDPLLRGLMLLPVKKPQRFSISPTDLLFGNQDLAAMNIQRGRDLGIQSYNVLREFCGIGRAMNFQNFSAVILDPGVVQGLAEMYGNPDNVDLYVGSLLEDPLVGGMVGPTIACLLSDQFSRLRDGDRFYYENPGIFLPNQVTELRRVSLARILCDNGGQIDRVPLDAFRFQPMNEWLPCSQIPVVDLRAWRET